MVRFRTQALLLYRILLFLIVASHVQQASSRSVVDLERGPPQANRGLGYRGFPAVVRLYEQELVDDEEERAEDSMRHNGESLAGELGKRIRLSRLLRFIGIKRKVVRIRETETNHLVDLLGGITKVGEYYTRVEIGGQQVRLQIDTGSGTMALPMAECDSCLPGDQRYDIKLSNSKVARWISCVEEHCAPDKCAAHKCARCSADDACCATENPSACGFFLHYGDGSGARGALMIDEMTWGRNGNGSESLSAQIVFGGILHDSKDFQRSTVDGILGMSYRALACNPSCVVPPFQQMVDAGVVKDKFEICVSRGGGKLILGDRDPSMAADDMKFAPLSLSNPPSYYTVNVSSTLYLNERELVLQNFEHGIVDSGTTLVVVTRRTFRAILDHLAEHYCHIPGLCERKTWFKPASCVHLKEGVLEQLPTFKFVVGSEPNLVELELRPEDYMIKYRKTKKHYRCVGIMAMPKLGHSTDVIFGNTLMQRYVTFYDRENSRVGFAISKGDCGGRPACSAYTQCRECAQDPECSYDFLTELCGPKHSGRTLLPFPTCTGSSCACNLGGNAGLIFGLVGGFFGAVVVGGLIVICWAMRRRKSSSDRNIRDPVDDNLREGLLDMQATTSGDEALS